MASENKRKIGVDVNELLKRKDILNSRTKFTPKVTVVKDINPEKVFSKSPSVTMPVSTKKADTKKKVSAFSVPEFPKVILKENSMPVEVEATPINADRNEYGQFTNYRTKEYDAFIDFIAQPPFVGKGIRTQKQFAKEYEVDETTLGRWKKRKGFWDEVEARAKDMRKDRTVKIFDKFYEQIMRSRKPVGRDILVWLQYIQNFNPKLGIVPMQPAETRLDPEERKQLAQAYLNAGLLTQQEAQMVVDEGLEPEDLEI